MNSTAADTGTLLGFETHAVDYNRPLIRNTGYRSLIGVHGNLPPA